LLLRAHIIKEAPMKRLVLSAFLSMVALLGTAVPARTAFAADPFTGFVRQAKAAVNDALARNVDLNQPDRDAWPAGVEKRFQEAEAAGEDDVTQVYSLSVGGRLVYLLLNDEESQAILFDGFGNEIAHGTSQANGKGVNWQ
jgi:hypothetical protein